MPNIRGCEQCELIAFLTIHFSPWNVISLPQLMSLVRADSGESRPGSSLSTKQCGEILLLHRLVRIRWVLTCGKSHGGRDILLI